MMQALPMQMGGWSQQGRLRPANGDAWAVEAPPDRGRQERYGALLAVAEGYAADGRELPWLGARVLEALGRHYFAAPPADRGSLLLGAVQAANRQVFAWRSQWGWQGAFAGLVTAAVTSREAVLAQVGDGQAFLLRGRTVAPLFPWARQAGPEGPWARRGPRILEAALGWQPQVPMRLNRLGLLPGDALLLCSGGFTASLPAWPSWAALSSPVDMVQAVDDGGGGHNRTVVLLRLPRAEGSTSRVRAMPPQREAMDWQPVMEVLGPVALAGALAALLLAAVAR